MGVPLTPELLAHAYDYLCCVPPFNKWNLPHSEDVKFNIIRKDHFAHYQMVKGSHHISVSSRSVGRHETLIATMAHEMIHLHMQAARIHSRNPHGRAFQKFADEVCRIHEFDRLTF